ncbi:MAG: hypothetical protein A2X67_09105 [Ignavibacteria bacterium GWA2_55_11]|nr:MAG: hypothetical protein A2X67_09105 [Ignavibacteria bacterium GWA2_55_11]OGU47569.1 MAG: hypothetical protein A2X68_05905 [Ignavibacteria bacterium GWC2_56_12]OGU70643.1 MAG: hypothetical protein A3H45_03090 [Ignavibacteria bacterium RIFCSPLOWO2_02_FULL_55_14]OGU73397.1 MAG: hypothetical protein A3G43_04925 [Ignavibacteria bacterium RIFCSPLOWO2_12_FULL_56_21]
MHFRFAFVFITLACFMCLPAYGQPSNDVKRELDSLRSQLDSLKALVATGITDEMLDKVAERLERRMQQLEEKIDASSRATTPIVFNPRTTAFLNFSARMDDRAVFDEEGIAEISNKMFLRSVELDLRAPVDPYAEGIIILAVEDEAGTGFALDPEEAYGIMKRLPILESAPLGLKLKVGKFRAPFGQNNRLHMHDLPWTTRPLVVSKFLGTEHGDFFESGYNPTGVDLDFFLPTIIPGTTAEMNIDMLRGGEIGLTQGHGGDQPAWLAHLTVSADWSNEHLLVLGASGYHNYGIATTSMVGVDVLYKWSPSERRDSRSFVVGGEAFSGWHAFPNSGLGTVTMTPTGWFGYIQYQLSYSLYAGIRVDRVEEPADESKRTQALSAYISYYTTEFLRIRVGVDHRQSDLQTLDELTTANLEINFVFGAHPTEPYWVNR